MRKNRIYRWVVLLLAVLLVPDTKGVELLVNGGFESGTYVPAPRKMGTEMGHLYYEANGGGAQGLSTPDGWIRSGSATRGWLMMDGDLNNLDPARNGEMAYRLDALTDAGLIQQNLNLVQGTIYELTFDLWSKARSATGGDAAVQVNFTGPNVTDFGVTALFDTAGSATDGALQTLKARITAVDTGVHQIEFNALSMDRQNSPYIDNISLQVSAYSRWAARRGLSGVPSDDYDGDHLSDFYEYALNGDPTDPLDRGRVQGTVRGDFFEYIYYKRTDDEQVVYDVVDTPNLVSGMRQRNAWDARAVGPSGVPNFEIVTNRYDLTSRTAQFIQLAIHEPGDGITGLIPNPTLVTLTVVDSYPNRASFSTLSTASDSPNKVWNQYPARYQKEAVPIGNGPFAAMIFGGVTRDVVQFNHENIWTPPSVSEAFVTGPLPSIAAEIAQTRDLIFAGQPYAAHQVMKNALVSYHVGDYSPFGVLEFEYDFGSIPAGSIAGYQRILDMETGVASSHFVKEGTTYDREVFVAKDKNVIALHMTANGPDKISTQIRLSRPAHFLH